MSWFKNPWLADKGNNPWAESNPWAQGKPEFQKAVGTAANRDDVQSGLEERDGGIIADDGKFTKIQATQDYFFKEQKKENLICSKNLWAKDKLVPKQYIKALAVFIKSDGIASISDDNIIFDARTGGIAAIYDAITADVETAKDENGVPSVLLKFQPISTWKMTVYTSPECLNYYSFRSILAHEGRHVEQHKILRDTLFADKDLTVPKNIPMLATTYAGVKVAMEYDAYRVQEEFMLKNPSPTESAVNLDLKTRKNKALLVEIEELVLKSGKPFSGIYKQQFEDARDFWLKIFKDAK